MNFEVTGTFDIPDNFEAQYDASGNITGYKLPDNRVVQLVVALEVVSPEENGFENVENLDIKPFSYITSENEMNELGFECLDYGHLEFTNPLSRRDD